MTNLTRRKFVRMMAAAGAATSMLGWPAISLAGRAEGRVVVVGGGSGAPVAPSISSAWPLAWM